MERGRDVGHGWLVEKSEHKSTSKLSLQSYMGTAHGAPIQL